MIITPDIFTPFHTEDIGLHSVNDEEILKTLIRDINFLNELVPPGVIIWINLNKENVQTPDPYFWQLCDGAEITANQSPLKTDPSLPDFPRLTPELMNCYAKMSPNLQRNNVINRTDLNTPGSQMHNLKHNHGGYTGNSGISPYKYGDNNNEEDTYADHRHSISHDRDEEVLLDAPMYMYLTPYLKIV